MKDLTPKQSTITIIIIIIIGLFADTLLNIF
jgi:hypothetical protein